MMTGVNKKVYGHDAARLIWEFYVKKVNSDIKETDFIQRRKQLCDMDDFA